MKEKHIKLCEKERKCIEARLRNERLVEEERKKILLKIASSDDKIKKQRDVNNRLHMERYIESSMRKDDIEDNILEKEKAMEFRRLQRLYDLEEKNKRVEDMKLQKLELYEQRRKMNREMQKHKEKMLGKFDYLMKNSKSKTKEEIMKELFDEDYSYVEDTTTKNKLNKSKSSVSLMNTQSNAPPHSAKKVETVPTEKKEEFEFLTNIGPTSGRKVQFDIKEEEEKEQNNTNDNKVEVNDHNQQAIAIGQEVQDDVIEEQVNENLNYDDNQN